MIQAKNLVHAGVLNSTNEQNHATNHLSNIWTMSKGQLIRQMEMMQKENEKQYNESQHYKNRCLELMEKLQKYQEQENPIEIRNLRVAI